MKLLKLDLTGLLRSVLIPAGKPSAGADHVLFKVVIQLVQAKR